MGTVLTGQDGTRAPDGKQYKNRLYLCDGRNLGQKYDGNSWNLNGIKKANYPDNVILTTAASGAAGAGNLNGMFVWLIQPVNNNHTTPTGRKVAGIPSLLSAPLTLNGQSASISGIPATHADSQVTGWDLYRNQAGAWQTGDDAGQDYKFVTYIPMGTTTYTDSVDDSLLVGVDSLRFNQNFCPAFNCIELYGDRLFGGGFDPITTGTATLATQTITNKALTSNVATITTSAAHGYVVGQYVTVNTGSHDQIFDGCHIISSTPLTTTFTYVKVNANVASVAETGTTEVINFSGGGVSLPVGVTGAWFQKTGDSARYRIITRYNSTQIAVDRGFASSLSAAAYTIYRDDYQVYFTEQYDVEAWGPDSEGLRYYLEIPGKESLRALLTYFGSLLVFAKQSIFTISGMGPDRSAVTISPHAVYADCGTFSRKSVGTVEEQIYFLTRRGLMVMNGGGQPALVSYKLLTDWITPLTDTDLKLAVVGCRGRYVTVGVPAVSGNAENSKFFTYDRYTDSWVSEGNINVHGFFQDDTDSGYPDTFYFQGASTFQPGQGSTDVTTQVYSGTVASNTTTSITDTGAAFPTTAGGLAEAYIEFFNASNVSQGKRRISANTATTATWSSVAIGGGTLAITNGWTYKIGHIHWSWTTRTLEDAGHQARVLFAHIIFDAYTIPNSGGTPAHISITEIVDGVSRPIKPWMPVTEQTLRYDFNTRGTTYALQVESWDGAIVREIQIILAEEEYK